MTFEPWSRDEIASVICFVMIVLVGLGLMSSLQRLLQARLPPTDLPMNQQELEERLKTLEQIVARMADLDRRASHLIGEHDNEINRMKGQIKRLQTAAKDKSKPRTAPPPNDQSRVERDIDPP